MAPFQGGESGSDNSESESDRRDSVDRRRRGADKDDDEEELQDTDDEQDTKKIVAVPFPRSEQPKDKDELQALIIQDLKTEDASEEGGYARRRVQRGSIVVVRGSDDGGDEATWVARVNKVYREKNGTLRVGITWFNRKSDIPAKEARRAKLAGDGPRQLLFSNAEDSIEAKYIRHPAVAWFLPAGAAPPRMRCGAGDTRHERVRPGFLVQRAYDSENERVYSIGGPELRRECPDLAKEVDRLVEQSWEALTRLQREEEEYDAKHGTQGKLEPLALRMEAEQQPSESESESEASSSSSDSESEDEGRLAAQAAALASKAAAAADAKRRRQEEAAERAAAAEAQKQRQLQEAVDAEALRLARALPQQAEQQQQRQQQDQQQQDQQQQGAAGPAAAAGDSAQQAITSPGSASGGWRRYAQQLQKHAGRLPWRTAPAPSKPGASGAGPASAAPKLSAEQAAAREAAEVQTLLQGCCTPSPKPLAALLCAVCGCTQAAAQGLFTEQVQLFFGRVLLTWLWHLVSLQLPDLQEAAKADPAVAEAAAEVAGCIELLLQALERQRYTPAYDKWLGLAQGHKLISALARNMQGAYPPGVQQAATQLKDLWTARAFKMREHLRQRQQQKEQEQKREAAKEKAEAQLLQRSPLASKAAALATSGLRATALGAGGATYVRPRHSPSPAAAAKLNPPPVLASLAGAPSAAAQRPTEQRRLSLSGAGGPAAAAREQQQPGRPAQPQQQQPGKPAQPQQQQQPGKPAQPKQQQQPGRPAQPQQQQQQQATKPTLAQVQTKAAAAGDDPLSAAWMNAFKGSPGGNQTLPRSATAPVQQTATIAKDGGAAAGAPGGPVPRSLSAPAREPRQQAAAAAAGAAASTSAALAGQRQAAPAGQNQGGASSAAPAAGSVGGAPSKAPMGIADSMLAQVKQKMQKRPAAEVIDVAEAAEQRAAKVARTAAKPQAPPGGSNHAGGSKGHNKLAALVKKAQRQGGRL